MRQRVASKEEAPKKKPLAERERTRAKLTYKETRELEALPGEIQALEAEQKTLLEKMNAPDYFRQTPEMLRADRERIGEIEGVLLEKLERWEALEGKDKTAAS